jgi:hypothetical protein
LRGRDDASIFREQTNHHDHAERRCPVTITTAWTATRNARGLTAAHSGATLACGSGLADAKPNGFAPMPFGVPAYVADQESHPPRERSVG